MEDERHDAPLLPQAQDGRGGPTRWDLRYHDAQLEQDFNETFISDAVMPGFRLMWARKALTSVAFVTFTWFYGDQEALIIFSCFSLIVPSIVVACISMCAQHMRSKWLQPWVAGSIMSTMLGVTILALTTDTMRTTWFPAEFTSSAHMESPEHVAAMVTGWVMQIMLCACIWSNLSSFAGLHAMLRFRYFLVVNAFQFVTLCLIFAQFYRESFPETLQNGCTYFSAFVFYIVTAQLYHTGK
jgi:hypothetical protein